MSNLTQQLLPFWKINWLRRSFIGLTSLLILLLLIPVAAQYGIIHLLQKQGATEASIEDINLNPFAGTFELKQLSFSAQDNSAATIALVSTDIRMLELLKGRIVVNDLQLQGVSVDVERNNKGEVFVNGLPVSPDERTEPLPAGEEEKQSEPLEFAINNLELRDIETRYQEPDFDKLSLIKTLSLKNIKSWVKSTPAKLELDMLLNQGPVTLSVDLFLFDEAQKFKGTASLKSLAFSRYAKFFRDHTDTLEGNVNVNTEFEVNISETFSATVKKDIEITQLNAVYQHVNLSTDKIIWKGLSQIAEDGHVMVKGDLTIGKTQARDINQDYLIASFDKLSVNELQQNAQSVVLDELELEKLLFIQLAKDKDFVKLDNFLLRQLSMKPDQAQLNIDQVELKSPDIQLEISEQKQITFLQPFLKTLDSFKTPADQNTATATTDKKEPEEAKPLGIDIKKLTLTEPGQLHLTDNSVSPHYKTRVTFNQIDLENISSNDPSHFKLALKQGEYTTVDIQGNGLLFDPTQQIKLTANIKQLDLPPVTPYTSKAMGYGMKSGVVDSDIDLKINKREIDSLVDLKIDSIEVVETHPETAEQVSSASGMSIDLAVSTLKDSDNIIELKLPVKGNLDKPDFDMSLIINKAMGKAMQSASLSYLKHTLQPFGSLITLFSLAKAAANHISLPPILFNSNSLELKEQQQDLLDKVLKVLKDRPGLKIKACGISALEDQTAIRNELIAAAFASENKVISDPKGCRVCFR